MRKSIASLSAMVCGVTMATLAALPNDASAAQSWMVFAINGKGAIGHGVSPDLPTARNFALSYCGQSGCKTVYRTKSRCHAIAHSFTGGYWFGVGNSDDKGSAMGFALNFCANNAPASSCKVAYTHCQ
jgi:Domain of unknown function (DUF4189)